MDLDRRRFLGGAAAFAFGSAAVAKEEEAYRFRIADAEIEMTIEFHDGYASHGFWLGEQMSNRRYCLSAGGEEGRNCLAAFRGSLAIARYRVRPRSRRPAHLALREYVRTIDHDARLPDRPPFERTIVLKKGVASDLQAFGYEPPSEDEPLSDRHGPWYLYRQDLYLEPQRAPFLILYWKHASASIRVLDLIPGDQTWIEKK
ncbi:MAG: hypothetical protein HYZ57_08660 [Acidobacteria bacterium]|nr:hypothetical protein [Acidobacteriota bacterium]